MWQDDKYLIQIALGKKVVDLTAKRHDRNLLDHVMGTKTPEPAQLIVDRLGVLRTWLQQNGNMYLPSVRLRDDEDIPDDAAKIYFGIETMQTKVQTVDDIINVLSQKVRKYYSQRGKVQQLAMLLAESASEVENNDYISAFQKVCCAYYFSVLEEQELERNIALGYAGNFSLRNGDFESAHAYLVAALDHVNSSNIFSAEMRAALCLDMGNLLRICGDRETSTMQATKLYQESVENFYAAVELAKNCNDTTRIYFSVCGAAGVAYQMDDLKNAAMLIGLAKKFVSDPNEKLILTELQEKVVEYHRDRLLAENRELKMYIKEVEDELKRQRFVNQVGKLFLQLLIAPTINTMLSGMGLLGCSIKVANCRFDGPAQIGFKNYANMLSQ